MKLLILKYLNDYFNSLSLSPSLFTVRIFVLIFPSIVLIFLSIVLVFYLLFFLWFLSSYYSIVLKILIISFPVILIMKRTIKDFFSKHPKPKRRLEDSEAESQAKSGMIVVIVIVLLG